MKGIFAGHIEVDSNAVFRTANYYKGNICSYTIHTLKNGVDPDRFNIGQEYALGGLVQ